MMCQAAQLTASPSGFGAEVSASASGSIQAEPATLRGQRVGIDVADGGSGLEFPVWRCRAAMALSKQWGYSRRMALNVGLGHGPVIFSARISQATAEVMVNLQPVFHVQGFSTEVSQKVKLGREPVVEELGAGKFPSFTVKVVC